MVDRSTVVNVLAYLFLAGGVAAAFYTHQSLAAAGLRVATRQAEERTREMRAQIREARKPSREKQTPAAAPAAEAAKDAVPDTAWMRQARGRGPGPGGVIVRPESLFPEHASLRTAFVNGVPSRVASLFGHFFAAQKLSAEEIAAFTQAIVERERSWMELQSVTHAGGAANADVAAAMYQEAVEDCNRELAALLGQDRFAQLETYRRDIEAREALKPLLTLADDRARLPAAKLAALAATATELGVFSPAATADAYRAFRERSTQGLTAQQIATLDLILDNHQIRNARLAQGR